MKNLRMLYVYFNNEISPREINCFRGAINAALEINHSILFHNHTNEGFRYSYPLIQYKRFHKKAVIVCVEEGTDAIGEFFNSECRNFTFGNNEQEFMITNLKADKFLVQQWQTMFHYKLYNWLPFNSKNYKEYQNIEGIVEKTILMERMLTGNILSFLKGIGVFVDDRVICHITSVKDPYVVRYKGVKLMSFDIEFSANVSLPMLIGLGKGASVGYGMILNNRTKTINSKQDE